MSKQLSPMSWRKGNGVAGRPWKGAKREYDLFKELTVGVIVVSLLVVAVSAIFSSPDDKSVTLKSWANSQPNDFVVTTNAELGHTSDSAGYGPPYNSTTGASQTIGALDLQSLAGVKIPVDSAKDFVIGPLSTLPSPPQAVSTWKAASSTQQTAWTDAYGKALDTAKGDPAAVASGDYGPVPAITGELLTMAKQGSLDSVLNAGGSFYNFNYTRSMLFLGDSAYFTDLATSLHLTGDQWGMINGIGYYPGQSWLWMFSLFYQIEPFKSLPNADLVIILIVAALTMVLMIVPLIPGLRDLPRLIPIHRLIWRDYYKRR